MHQSFDEYNDDVETEFIFDFSEFVEEADPTDEELALVEAWLSDEGVTSEIGVEDTVETPEVTIETGMESLKYVEQLNRMAISKEINDIELQNQKDTAEFNREQQALSLKTIEANLLAHRDTLRPCKMAQAVVVYDSSERQFRAQTVDYSIGLEDMEDTHAIVAYGASPAEALDNFDYLWNTGEQK